MNSQTQIVAGTVALVNPLWMSWLTPLWQGFIAVLGAILLVLMILNKYTEWQQRKKDLKDATKK